MIYLGIAGFFAFSNQSISASMAMMMMFITIYVSYPFAVGDQNGIDTLYIICGIDKKHVVQGRYLWMLLMNFIGALCSLGVAYVFSWLFKIPMNHAEAIAIFVGLLGVFIVMQATQLPIFFKVGYIKAKTYTYLLMVTMMALIVGSSYLLSQVMSIQTLAFLASHLWLIVVIGGCLVLAALGVSYFLSLKFYENREMTISHSQS